MSHQDSSWQRVSPDIGLSNTYKYPFIRDDNVE